MTLVDVHLHLAACAQRETLLDLARGAPMLLVSCTVNATEAAENLRLRSELPERVRCFLGVHPSDATAQRPTEALGPLLALCDGIGEIGLDEKYSSTAEGGAQMMAFRDQLEAAERLGKPVQVHSRGSERACLDVLSTFRLRSVLMHWFEAEALVSEVVGRGYFVSVGPAILYSKKVRRIARALPGGSVLTESDGPVAYAPLGSASGPALVASVVYALAQARGEAYPVVEDRVEENAARFLSSERLI